MCCVRGERAASHFQRILRDPPQLIRFVVGRAPSASVKLCLRHRCALLLMARVGLGDKLLREGCRPVVRDDVARARQRYDDVVALHLDVEVAVIRHQPILAQKGTARGWPPTRSTIDSIKMP